MKRKTRRVRSSTAKRTRIVRRAVRKKQIEDEALDLLIIDSLKNVSMTMASLERATDVSETRLRKRLAVLLTRGVIARERRGRSIYYVSRVDEVVERDN